MRSILVLLALLLLAVLSPYFLSEEDNYANRVRIFVEKNNPQYVSMNQTSFNDIHFSTQGMDPSFFIKKTIHIDNNVPKYHIEIPVDSDFLLIDIMNNN